MPRSPKAQVSTSSKPSSGPLRRSSRGRSAEPAPQKPTAKDKGKGKALEPVEEKESDDAPGDVLEEDAGKAAPAEEKKKPMTLEEYFGPDIDVNQPLYRPHGKWEYTYGKDFKDVECIKRLSHGAQSEVWYNSATVEGGERFDYITKKWSVWAEWRGFFAEIYLYASSRHLRPLQGVIVPNFIGIHNVLGGFISFAMEPMCKIGWNEAHPRMPRRLKEIVVEAFEKLHAQGVLHNDVELRHMLFNDAQDKVTIIDFQESRSLYPCEDVGLRACTEKDLEAEMEKVKDLIDWWGDHAETRRKLNRAKRNYRRAIQREQAAGEWEDPGWYWKARAPSWYTDTVDHEPSDDEEASDEETAEWEESLEEDVLLKNEEPDTETVGRRFTVPTEKDREAARWAAGETERLLLEQRRLRIEMEKKKATEEAKAAKTKGNGSKTSDAEESTTVNEAHEGTPAESERPAVHFAVDTDGNQSQADFSVEVMPFKAANPPTAIERTTPGIATESEIHPPGSESTILKLTSPPPPSPKEKPKKLKATTTRQTRSTKAEPSASASGSSGGRVTRSMTKKEEDEATPMTRSATKQTKAKTSGRKAPPEAISTGAGSSGPKRKRAVSVKQSASANPSEPKKPRKAATS